MMAVIREHERKQREYEAAHGQIKPIISAEFAGHRIVAVGHKLHWAKQTALKVFPDFLNQYLHSALGKEWGAAQVALKFDVQHQIVQWQTIWTTRQQQQKPDSNGLYTSDSGAGIAWFRLAYDVYLLEHHGELQRKLLRRLRDPVQFQGARFEIMTAAAMLPAGYELEFEDDKLPGKHTEFVATHRGKKDKIAVEAKSRHRDGIMGFKGEKSDPQQPGILGLLRGAIAKDPEHPLLVFIELNMPILVRDGKPPASLVDELERSWNEIQAADWPKGFPAIGVIFYNDCTPWFLEAFPQGEAEVFALAMRPNKHRHAFDEQPLLGSIMEAIYQRLTIPKEFPK